MRRITPGKDDQASADERHKILVDERNAALAQAREAKSKLEDRARRIELVAAERDQARTETKKALAEAKELRRQVNSLTLEARKAADRHREIEREIREYEKVVDRLRPLGTILRSLPPPALRLNVGTQTSQSNFLLQGSNSSKRVLQAFGSKPTGPVLDWGCGSGRTLNWLCADPAWREQYHGCDVDRAAIDWLRSQGFQQATVCGDTPPLPYPAGFFELIFSFSVLTHIPPEAHRSWYAEFARVLRPGGRVLVTTLGDFALTNDLDGRLGGIRDLIARQGYAFDVADGHYKHIAFASRAFSRQSFAGLLEEVAGDDHYGSMDVFILQKPLH